MLQADVQKAYAAGIGQFGSNSGGGGGSAMSHILGLGIGLQAAGTLGSQVKNMFGEMNPAQAPQPAQPGAEVKAPEAAPAVVKCPNCGADLPEGAKFCLNCGEKVEIIPEGMVKCPDCGKIVPKGKFCLECGHKFVSTCPNCGAELPAGAKFCLECGTKVGE